MQRRLELLAAGSLLVGCGRLRFEPVARDGRALDVAEVPDAGIAGLVSWFRFEDTSGDTFVDSIGGELGTCSGTSCPIATPGHLGQGYLFDGVDDCISVPDDGRFALPELTVAVWARQDAFPQYASQIAKRVDIGATVLDSWQIEDIPTGQLFFTSTDSGMSNAQILSANNTLIAGVWQHLAVSWDGTTQRMYVAGAPVGAGSLAGPPVYDSHAMTLGCDDDGGIAEPFPGALDEIQIYDRALTDAEVAELAAR